MEMIIGVNKAIRLLRAIDGLWTPKSLPACPSTVRLSTYIHNIAPVQSPHLIAHRFIEYSALLNQNSFSYSLRYERLAYVRLPRLIP